MNKTARPCRWLILSHGFNMDGRAASQTITDKIPHLRAAGIVVQVLSAITGERDRHVAHRQLLPWGPSGLRFDFRHWLVQRVGRGLAYRLLTPLVSLLLGPFTLLEKLALGVSSQWSWALPAALVGIWRVRTGQVDVLYSTGGAWSAHLAGWWIQRITGVHWIAEIHDPMVPPGQTARRPSRDERARAWLEGKICSDADFVWWFTEGAWQHALQRHPQLENRGFAVLAGAEPPQVSAQHAYSSKLRIGHFGSLAAGRSLAPFLAALAAFIEEVPTARSRIEVHVYGARLDGGSADAVRRLRLDDMVFVHGRIERDSHTGLSGREQIMQRMQASDVLLLLHGDNDDCAEYIPSKFYEYLWTRRPIFAITHLNPQLDGLVGQRAGYLAHTDDPAGIVDALHRLLRDWQNRQLPEDVLPAITVKSAVDEILARVGCR